MPQQNIFVFDWPYTPPNSTQVEHTYSKCLFRHIHDAERIRSNIGRDLNIFVGIASEIEI